MLQTVKVQLQTNKRTLQTTKCTLQILKRMMQTTKCTLQTLKRMLQTTKRTLQTHWVQLQTFSAHMRIGNRTMRSGSVGVLYQHRSVNILFYAPTPWFVASRTTFIKTFFANHYTLSIPWVSNKLKRNPERPACAIRMILALRCNLV